MMLAMSIVGGIALGYFGFQTIFSNSKGKTRGRLHKSSSDRKIAGVCGGIAEYLGVDPVIIRLAWALLAFGWGTGILIYILCACILPEE